MLTANKLFSAVLLSGAMALAFAQDNYEADTDAAWIASQNGGNTELNDGNNDEPNAACIGDGCSPEDIAGNNSNTDVNSADDNSASSTPDSANVADTTGDSTAIKTANDSLKVAAQDDDYCTPADSLLPECQDVPDDNETNTYDRYIQENAEQYQARKEGFSRRIHIGFRLGGGMNLPTYGNKIEDWNFGYDLNAGLLAQMPFLARNVTLTPELDFSYRHYSYESGNSYSDNEAEVSVMLFEIPMIIGYHFDDDGFFVGIGPDLALKLAGYSTFKQTIDTGADAKDGKRFEKDKRKNTLPTSGVEVGAAIEIGYMVNNHFSIDFRAVQYFTNLLNKDVVAESGLMKTELHTLHLNLGFALLL